MHGTKNAWNEINIHVTGGSKLPVAARSEGMGVHPGHRGEVAHRSRRGLDASPLAVEPGAIGAQVHQCIGRLLASRDEVLPGMIYVCNRRD
jgi:hypothetical protein